MPHGAGRLQFGQSLRAAEPPGTARARGRSGCMPGAGGGHAARSAAALEVPPTCGRSQLFAGFPFQHCHLHVFYYELIPNLLSEKDQTSPFVFVGCFLCLLLSRLTGFEVRLKGKRGSRVRGAQLGEAIAGWKHEAPEPPAPGSPCPGRDPPDAACAAAGRSTPGASALCAHVLFLLSKTLPSALLGRAVLSSPGRGMRNSQRRGPA